MDILIVEDDSLQATFLEKQLRVKLAPRELGIRVISTESSFIERFSDIVADPPSLILMDVMLRWCDPSPDMPIPPREVVEESYYNAGIRCYRKLSETSATSHIPVILYTVLESEDIERELGRNPHRQDVIYIPKTSEFDEVVEAINRLVI